MHIWLGRSMHYVAASACLAFPSEKSYPKFSEVGPVSKVSWFKSSANNLRNSTKYWLHILFVKKLLQFDANTPNNCILFAIAVKIWEFHLADSWNNDDIEIGFLLDTECFLIRCSPHDLTNFQTTLDTIVFTSNTYFW